jgi:hypothetical protein
LSAPTAKVVTVGIASPIARSGHAKSEHVGPIDRLVRVARVLRIADTGGADDATTIDRHL